MVAPIPYRAKFPVTIICHCGADLSETQLTLVLPLSEFFPPYLLPGQYISSETEDRLVEKEFSICCQKAHSSYLPCHWPYYSLHHGLCLRFISCSMGLRLFSLQGHRLCTEILDLPSSSMYIMS